MKITIKFDTDNAAFEDASHLESGRVLRRVAERIETHPGLRAGDSITLRDSNGNTIGEVRFS